MAKKKNTINESGARQGRPPVPFYDEYCPMLIQHMSGGYSFETFGAHINVSKDTLYRWVQEYPDFCEAKKMGEIKSRQWWEDIGKEGMSGCIQGFVPSIWVFNMKNKFGYRDQIDANIKSEHTNVNVNVNVEGKVSELLEQFTKLLDVKKEAVQIKDVTPRRIKSS